MKINTFLSKMLAYYDGFTADSAEGIFAVKFYANPTTISFTVHKGYMEGDKSIFVFLDPDSVIFTSKVYDDWVQESWNEEEDVRDQILKDIESLDYATLGRTGT